MDHQGGTTLSMPLDAFSPAQSQATATPEIDDEVKRLRSCHELYTLYAPRWEFYLAAFNGGEDFATGSNLFRYPREAEPDYQERLRRADNMNYCEPLVSFFTNFIFSESIDRGGGKNAEFYKTFIQDVSKRKESVDDYMRQVSDDMQIFGMSYTLVDTPPIPEDEGSVNAAVVSKQVEEEQGMRPYWVLMQPTEILDWDVDAFGQLLYAKRKQVKTKRVGAERRTFEVYTEFYPDRYEISEVDISRPQNPELAGPVITLDNRLGRVPIEVGWYRRNKACPHIGVSFLCDFAYNNRKILNLTSMLDEFLYKQCFNILAKETDSAVPLREQEEGLVGVSNVMEYPKGASKPEYITPPVDPAKVIQDERGRIITQMYLRASQDTMNELFNGEKSSGFSQAQSFSRTVPFISSRADALERLEQSLMATTMEMVNKEWDGKINYKDRYELTNLTSALTQLQVLVKDFQISTVSETFVKSQLVRMLHEYDGKLSVDDQAKIEKEIQSMDFKAWTADQKTAFLGAPKTSPGAQQQPKKDVLLSEKEGEEGTSGHATVKIQD